MFTQRGQEFVRGKEFCTAVGPIPSTGPHGSQAGAGNRTITPHHPRVLAQSHRKHRRRLGA